LQSTVISSVNTHRVNKYSRNQANLGSTNLGDQSKVVTASPPVKWPLRCHLLGYGKVALPCALGDHPEDCLPARISLFATWFPGGCCLPS